MYTVDMLKFACTFIKSTGVIKKGALIMKYKPMATPKRKTRVYLETIESALQVAAGIVLIGLIMLVW